MKQRVVVLGASGFIGRRVVAALAALDWALPVAASRHATRTPFAGALAVDVDVTDVSALRAVLVDAAVVNCIAGAPALIESTAAAVFAAAASSARQPRVVHLGSLAAYGTSSGVVDESSPLRGDLDEYSAAKARSDRLAAANDFVITLRPGIVYGPGSPWWSDRIARLLIAHRIGDLGAAGAGICNLVYVDDVASAVVRALELPLQDVTPRAFNLALAEPLRWNEYFAAYAAALSALPLRSISTTRLAFETRVFSPPLKLLELALRGPRASRWNPLPPIRPWLPALCAHDIRLDVSRAEQVLGMRWTPLQRGLAITAAWFRDGGRTPS